MIDTNLGVNIVGELPYNFVVDAGAVPGYHSEGDDNRNGDSSRNGAFRVPYFALVGYRFTPTFLFAAGAADLERRDARWIPVAGLIWLPDDNTRIDIDSAEAENRPSISGGPDIRAVVVFRRRLWRRPMGDP